MFFQNFRLLLKVRWLHVFARSNISLAKRVFTGSSFLHFLHGKLFTDKVYWIYKEYWNIGNVTIFYGNCSLT